MFRTMVRFLKQYSDCRQTLGRRARNIGAIRDEILLVTPQMNLFFHFSASLLRLFRNIFVI